MSNFSKERLYEVYTRLLPTLGEIQAIAEKENINFEIEVSSSGRIELTSKDWTEDLKNLKKMYIRQTKESITDGCEVIKYE